jgi:2-methylcitrate dehydratase PrpD
MKYIVNVTVTYTKQYELEAQDATDAILEVRGQIETGRKQIDVHNANTMDVSYQAVEPGKVVL